MHLANRLGFGITPGIAAAQFWNDGDIAFVLSLQNTSIGYFVILASVFP